MTACPCNIVSFQDTSDLEDLLRHIIPVVPALPHSMALDSLRHAYIEFARRSSILVCRLNIDYQAGVCDYILEAPDGYSIYSVEGIEHPQFGFLWYPGSYGYISGFQDSWSPYHSGRFKIIDNNVLHLYQTPTVDNPDGLKVYTTVLPTECVSQIPTSIAIPFGRGIAQKVIADALCIPDKGWTSPNLAKKYEAEFNRTVLYGKQLASRNRQRGPLKARPLRIV